MYCYNCMSEIPDGEVCRNCLCSTATEPSPHHLKPGQILNGKYLVGNCIGEGGFGITYIGKDLVLDIKVAIKEFFPNGYVNRNNSVTQIVTATTEAQQDFFNKGKVRFLEEAKNIAKFIDEPGVVSVREFFEANSTAYIIMEYLDGENLSRYVKRNGKMPANKVFSLMLPIMKSLNRVHQAGIIHRDISPDNIMYMKNGTLKLMDFGSARYFANEEKEMSIMLKQGYAPEEQYRKNGHQGPWTDVYGLCATIYRCITGIVPLDALDRMHEDKLRKPSQIGVEISPQLEAVLMFGLAINHERRYKNMMGLMNGVQQALSQNYNAQNTQFSNNRFEYAEPPHNADDPRLLNQTVGAEQLTYGDNFTRREYEDVVPETERSNTGVIIGAIVILLLLFAAIGAFFYFIMPMIQDSQDNKKTYRTDQAVTETVTETESESITEEEKLKVPDVEGMQLEDAEEKLYKEDLIIDIEYTDSSKYEDDYVLKQYPPANKECKPGDKITLYVVKHTEPTEPPTEKPTKAPTEDTSNSYEDEIDRYVSSVDYTYDNRYLYSDISDGYIPAGTGNLNYSRDFMFADGELVLAIVTNADDPNESHWYYFDRDELVYYYCGYMGGGYYPDEFSKFNKKYNKHLDQDEARILEEAYSL